jgi:hypothetical protein
MRVIQPFEADRIRVVNGQKEMLSLLRQRHFKLLLPSKAA